MAYTPFLAGQKVTAGALNSALLVGAVVFRAYRNTTAQTITNGTESTANALSWDSIGIDDLAGWSAGTPTRWTVPMTGWYTLAGSVAFSGDSTGSTRDALWFVNGAIVTADRARSAPSAASHTVEARTLPQFLAAGQYVELVAAHNATGSINTATGTLASYMSVTYSRPA